MKINGWEMERKIFLKNELLSESKGLSCQIHIFICFGFLIK
jgi:hypothetical protein